MHYLAQGENSGRSLEGDCLIDQSLNTLCYASNHDDVSDGAMPTLLRPRPYVCNRALAKFAKTCVSLNS